jgi:N-acetylmuramoyl-L-alanine amidase
MTGFVPLSHRTPAAAAAACLLLSLTAVPARAQMPAGAMYEDALAKERAVRKALASSKVAPTVLKAVRTVVADFEALVRRYPTSSYCDDALWYAGRLSLDAFARFQDVVDRDAGQRLLRRLASQYPSSKFANQVAPQIVSVPSATPARAVTTIRDIRRTVLPDAVRITIELDGEVEFRDERLANPVRVYVDLAATLPASGLVDRTIRFDGDADVIRQLRIGLHPNNTTRVVLDAAGISSYSIYPLYSPYRLVIDCIRDMPVPVVAQKPPPPRPLPPLMATAPARPPAMLAPASAGLAIPAPAAAPLDAKVHRRRTIRLARALAPTVRLPDPARVLPGRPTAGGTVTLARGGPAIRGLHATAAAPSQAVLDARPSTPATAAPSTAVRAPARNLAGGFSIARQLGLGVSRIVIDPGHGGHDPGAVGRGLTEAALVLDIALRLEALLAAVPGVEVVLTRRTDEFVTLQERTAKANRVGADLFLSIHANASNNTRASGFETYFLNFATNASAAAIAARENAASGQPMGALPDFVKAIALNNKLDESREFASFVQRALGEGLPGMRNLGVKQAPFVVLIGAAMPSVLSEIAFVTNAEDVKQLRGNAARQRIAEALFNAIRRYQTSLRADGKIAQQ